LSQSSVSASTVRVRSTLRKPRPFSIHVTGVSKDKNGIQIDDKVKDNKEQQQQPQPLQPGRIVKQPATPKHPIKKQIKQKTNEEIKKN